MPTFSVPCPSGASVGDWLRVGSTMPELTISGFDPIADAQTGAEPEWDQAFQRQVTGAEPSTLVVEGPPFYNEAQALAVTGADPTTPFVFGAGAHVTEETTSTIDAVVTTVDNSLIHVLWKTWGPNDPGPVIDPDETISWSAAEGIYRTWTVDAPTAGTYGPWTIDRSTETFQEGGSGTWQTIVIQPAVGDPTPVIVSTTYAQDFSMGEVVPDVVITNSYTGETQRVGGATVEERDAEITRIRAQWERQRILVAAYDDAIESFQDQAADFVIANSAFAALDRDTVDLPTVFDQVEALSEQASLLITLVNRIVS
jgi:hypothetical protein